jgi:SynChlorMet cassette protein ScmD
MPNHPAAGKNPLRAGLGRSLSGGKEEIEETCAVVTYPDRPIANPMIVLSEEFDDHALLFDPDSGRVLGLNPVSVFIGKRLDGNHTHGDILTELKETFENVPVDAEEHLAEFLRNLTDRGFVGYESAES